MWKCPKCGREFTNTNQDHYCGKVLTIDEYIAEQDESIRPLLQQVRETIRAAAPDATEKISWAMPSFWQGAYIIHFAAFKSISVFTPATYHFYRLRTGLPVTARQRARYSFPMISQLILN